MQSISYYNNLIDKGLSLLVANSKKQPIHAWKKCQEKPLTKDEFECQFNNEKAAMIGLVTGYNNIEAIDIDLKILNSLHDQQAFWNELKGFISDNIEDFDNKFVITKTINNGYHIIYRCSKIEGNLKLAKLKDHKEAIIETRGKGGYIAIYDNIVSKKNYSEIQEISELEREILFSICKTYDFKGEENHIKFETTHKEINEAKITPWQDYNSKTSIFDIIGSDFNNIKSLSDKFIIKRHGAKSAHSGYVYKNSGCMYLFTTATIYPHEKLVTPFIAYTYKFHNGNFSDAAKKLYSEGFGSRIIKQEKTFKTESYKIDKSKSKFPIDIFPASLKIYLIECSEKMGLNIDYMACSMIWMFSVIIGNSIEIHVKNGWIEKSILWIVLVGKTGIGKTPAIKNIIRPLMTKNIREIRNYNKQMDKYEEFQELSKKEKENSEQIDKPVKKQFIVNDITQESLFELHNDVKNSIGVYKDELAGWIKEMNKYREGGDKEFWLSSYSHTSVYQNRKTAKSAYIQNPYISVIGGIQPTIFKALCNEENQDSGFIDRMLLCYPNTNYDYYNEEEVSEQLLEFYHENIIRIYDEIKELIQYDEMGEVISHKANFLPDAKKSWVQYFNEVTDLQRSDEENEQIKSIYPKIKSYVPRLSLILNTINAFEEAGNSLNEITKKSVDGACKLADYFIYNVKKVKIDIESTKDLKTIYEKNKDKPVNEIVNMFYEIDNNFNKSIAAELLGISRTQLYRIIEKLKK